jgi:RNA-directed DNA polymerase
VQCLKMRITDRHVLKLIRMWLQSPVMERDDDGRVKGTRPKQGTPQGGVTTPPTKEQTMGGFWIG